MDASAAVFSAVIDERDQEKTVVGVAAHVINLAGGDAPTACIDDLVYNLSALGEGGQIVLVGAAMIGQGGLYLASA